MGGAQVVILLSAFVRTKVIALTLGAAGVGLIGIFNAFSGNISSLAGWGLGTSGVRLVSGADEADRPSKAAALRRMGWMLSLIGLAVALMTFWPVGLATFESDRYVVEMAIVALSVPCVIASSAWSAVLQASGKIRSLAKVQITGALAGLLLGLPAIYVWGTIGIAISIFLAAAVPAFALWRASKSEFLAVPPASPESSDLRLLISLGALLMLVGWVSQLSGYAVRLAIVRYDGLEAAGFYQAAFVISGSLTSFIFAAMGADFFPMLAATKNDAESIEIVEKQMQAGLLIGVPLFATIFMFGEGCVCALYSHGLDPAASLLPWMTWSVCIRILSWPMGFWLIAKESPLTVVVVETTSSIFLVLITFMLLEDRGVEGAALATFFSGGLYLMATIWIAYKKTRKHLTLKTWACAGLAACLLGLSQALSSMHASPIFMGFYAIILAGISAWLCLRNMNAANSEHDGQKRSK